MGIYPPQHVCPKFPYLRYTERLVKTAMILKVYFTVAPVSKNLCVFVAKSPSSLVYLRMTLYGPASPVTAVAARLFLGSLADAERLAKDNPYKIRTVITLCEQRVKQRASGIRYLQFPVRDAQPIPIALLNAILEAIYQAVAEGATLVHCHSGISEAPTLVAAFLDQTGSARFESALRLLRKLRPEIAPAPNLIRSITSQIVYED